MLYTLLNKAGTAFVPERNLIRSAYGIDGGGGIAADGEGRVYVFWHAPLPGHKGEEWRRVWMTRSDDDGQTFEPEHVAWDQPTGACSCCSLNAHADRSGTVYVLFRSAQEMVQRNMYLLESKDHGSIFRGSEISKWNVGYCVMSSEAFASTAGRTFAAWETERTIHFGSIGSGSVRVSDSLAARPGTNQKYPSLAIDRDGMVLVSWTEGMAWKRGGSVHWQLFSRAGQPLGQRGSANGIPAWSLVSAYPQPNGNFVVLY